MPLTLSPSQQPHHEHQLRDGVPETGQDGSAVRPRPRRQRTRTIALYLIAAIVVTATTTAFVQSYDGLYQWARRYLDEGWARTWPLQVDAWIAVGELALYVAYRDAWPARRKFWPWAAAFTGLLVSTAFNVGHLTGVDLAGHITAAVPPVAAFAGLALGLQVLKYVEAANLAAGPETRAMTGDDDSPEALDRPVDVNERRPSQGQLLARARTILASTPTMTGRQLGEHLNVSERTGRRLLRRAGRPVPNEPA